MYAIIQTGGKQYKVEQGQTLYIEKLNVAEGETVGYIPSIIFTKDNVHDYEF